MPLYKSQMKSPVGLLTLVADDDNLLAVLWPKEKVGRVRLPDSIDKETSVLRETQKQLDEYFEGKRTKFDLPIKFSSGTTFQMNVWKALTRIPYGETRSYKDLARLLGSQGAVRAIGAANGRNPLSIVVPCHRVIAADGSLSGFAGGLESKQFLLDLEKGSRK